MIFNNMPPRMVVAELEMNITCPDECFQAPTALECFAALATWARKVPHYHQYSIASVLETMFQRDLSVEKKELYAHFGILNLFILVTGTFESFQGLAVFMLIMYKPIKSFTYLDVPASKCTGTSRSVSENRECIAKLEKHLGSSNGHPLLFR